MRRADRYRFDGGTAIVTGAASGIGAALAAALAERGSSLGLVDVDGERLSAVAERLRAVHPALTMVTETADLSDLAALPGLAERLLTGLGAVTLLVNNAGVALGGRFRQVSLDDFDWVLRTNFQSTVHLTYHLLPALAASHGSHLVNMSSLYGLIAPPGEAAYAASKFAVRGFTEALRHELAGSGIGVTVVHPGGVRTAIARNARVGAHVHDVDVERSRRRAERMLTAEPADVARDILNAVERRRPRVLVGDHARLPDLIARVAPARYWDIIGPVVRRR